MSKIIGITILFTTFSFSQPGEFTILTLEKEKILTSQVCFNPLTDTLTVQNGNKNREIALSSIYYLNYDEKTKNMPYIEAAIAIPILTYIAILTTSGNDVYFTSNQKATAGALFFGVLGFATIFDLKDLRDNHLIISKYFGIRSLDKLKKCR